MPETIQWTVQFTVVGGPVITKSNPLTVDAYDKATESIPVDGTPSPVNMPEAGDDTVKLIVISAEPCGDWLSYKIDSGADPVTLDAPHTFIGAGAVKLMQATYPKKLTFTVNTDAFAKDTVNSKAKASIVQILVGRSRKT